nr:MAG TPA: hypothetical protein [Caudoviricetes sp.]DAV06892.1 MAG TPA: hypothetical protein [Caudoviricetes sp.]
MNPMQLMGLLNQSNNPLELIQNMAGQNPLMGRALQMGKGKSVDELKVIAQNLARQRGMNEKQLGQFLSGFGLRL